MHIASTNLSQPTTIRWNGKDEKTGIYKLPVAGPIILTPTGVEGDHVADRKHHGGTDMAFYLYPYEHYDFWKTKYPELNWQFGMFGENLTTTGLLENAIRVGDIFRLGNGLVQAIQPRQPCYKLGVKFKTQQVLKDFITAGLPGIYFRVLESCIVNNGSEFMLEERASDGLSITDVFVMLYETSNDRQKIEMALNSKVLPENCKAAIAHRQRMEKR